MADTYKSDISHRLDQGLGLKNEWRRYYHSAASSTETPTPVDYAALGREGNAVRRAQREALQTAEERSSYRAGYLAGSQAASRMRAVLGRALRSLRREGSREIL